MAQSHLAPAFEGPPGHPATRVRRWWRSLGTGGQLALGLLLALRVGWGVVGLLAAEGRTPQATGGGETWSRLVSVWQRWDAAWYHRIATEGYRPGNGTVHFWPLYPLLARVAALPVGGHVALGQLLVSSGAFLAAMWLLYKLARVEAGPDAARLAVLLTAFFPTGFFLLAPYTESLYLALTVAAFWFARTGRPWAAGAAGCGAALTRAFGVLLALPLAFEYLRRRRQQGRRPGFGLVAAALPVLGLAAFDAHNRLLVGERRSMLEVAAPWGDRPVPFWESLSASWTRVAGRADPIESLNLLCLLGFCGLALGVARRLPPAYGLYVGPYLVFLLSRETSISPLGSVSRYTLVLFPCLIVLALWLARRPRLAAGWLALSALLETALLVRWVLGGWVA